MLIVHSVHGVPIRLTRERWRHICRRHPELVDQQEKLAVRFYRRTPLTSKYLVVAYKELGPQDGFVVTAYFARRLATWRERPWKR